MTDGVVYGDDVCNEVKKMKQLIANIINKISKILTQWNNRRLLARINRVYENDYHIEEKKMLAAYRKSFRKLIEDEW